MIELLLSMILFGQGIPAPATDTGTITGVLKTATGEPAPGIRVTAMTLPDNTADAALSVSYGGLTQTDEAGRYRLDNIAPGRYYVAAGRVDLPTYFPGSLDRAKGTTISIASKAVVPNIDFVVDEASFRLPGSEVTNFIGSITGLTVPVQVRMEGNLKQPVMADGRPVLIKFTRMQDQSSVEMTLNDSIQNFSIPNPSPGAEYRVTVENLPRGYVVRSMLQEGVDLRNDTLKLTAKNFALTGVAVTGAMAPGAHVTPFRSNAGVPMTPLEITLAAAPVSGQAVQGVRVTGRASSTGFWYLSISGNPGILFADGSFEFRGVAPGRHVILLQDRPVNPSRILAASVVLGNTDLEGVLTDEVRVMPAEVRFPGGTPSPGTIPLAWIHGKVIDDASKEPVFGGTVTVTGRTRTAFPIDSLGEFQIPRLLPGTYDLSIEGFQHSAVRQSVVVGDEDVSLNVSARATN
jgi:hypothetical protein